MRKYSTIAMIVIVSLAILIVTIRIVFNDKDKVIIRTVLSGKEWLNTPYGVDSIELKKKTTLLVFWNISCINCKKSISAANEWKTKYGERLQIVGIHTPEFAFEKESKNVIKAIEEQKIKWPVLLDNDKKMHYSFGNEYVPALYLINNEGKIIYTHNGDGDYGRSETAIQAALKDANTGVLFPAVKKEELTGICFVTTPDIYCGTNKGAITNKDGYLEEKIRDYKLPAVKVEDSLALKGRFKATKEYVESNGLNAELVLEFAATEVNLVADLASNKEAIVEILMSGKPLKTGVRGKDLDSKEQVKIKGPGVYQLLKNYKKVEKGTITVRVIKGDIKAYAFRFYGCSE